MSITSFPNLLSSDVLDFISHNSQWDYKMLNVDTVLFWDVIWTFRAYCSDCPIFLKKKAKKEVKLVKRLEYYSLGLCISFRICSLQYLVHACIGQLEQLLKQLHKLEKRPNCFNTFQLFWRICITLLESICTGRHNCEK